jgi:bifunctional DNA-binding transcriptional regulator/antitoxin component of YhaV-PrlF toxin-antitoxin module
MLATLTSKSQITLPKNIPLLLKLEPGAKVAFLPMQDGQIAVSKASNASFGKLRGTLPQPARAFTVEEMNQAMQDAAAARHVGA